jgi:hypothetical protein
VLARRSRKIGSMTLPRSKAAVPSLAFDWPLNHTAKPDLVVGRDPNRLEHALLKPGRKDEILRDRRVSSDAFGVLRKMRPVRQVQTAQLMVASHTYTGRFAAALLAGTGRDMLLEGVKSRPAKTLPQEQRARLIAETEALLQNRRAVEESYGAEVLTLSVYCRYV